jgi:hypothetical protein
MYKFANALGTEHFVSEYCNEYNFKWITIFPIIILQFNI